MNLNINFFLIYLQNCDFYKYIFLQYNEVN